MQMDVSDYDLFLQLVLEGTYSQLRYVADDPAQDIVYLSGSTLNAVKGLIEAV